MRRAQRRVALHPSVPAALVVLVVTALVLAGCSGDGGDAASGSERGADEAALLPGGDDPLLTCGDGLAFHASALDAPAGFDLTDDPLAEALRAFLAASPGVLVEPVESGSWRLLARTGSEALVAVGSPPEATMTFERDGDAWTWVGSSSGCGLRPALPPGVGRASWGLDPDQPPSPDDDTVHVLVTEAACAGAQPIGDRLVGPDVREGNDEVVIAFGVEPLPGMNTCPGNPPLAVTVLLDAPLGDRTLLDGSWFPPAPPELGPPFGLRPG